MKTIKLLFLIFLALFIGFNPILAQNWVQVSSPTQVELKDIAFIDNNIGIIVGQSGVILKTTNGGNSWLIKNSNETINLQKVCFIDNQTVVVSALLGRILRSTNQGETWSTINTPTSSMLWSISFVDNLTGYVSGLNSTILKTTNAGLNWVLQGVAGSDAYWSCHFFNATTGIVGQASNNVKRTTDSGNNWLTVLTVANDGFVDFVFINPTTGFVFGDNGSINKTTNAGNNWIVIQPRGIEYRLNSGGFINATTGFVVGWTDYTSKGLVIKTTNAGDNWFVADTVENILNSFAKNNYYLYAVGENGSIYRTANPIGIREISSQVPDKYSLSQNYPNPFNPTTNIEFSVPKTGAVKLIVFDLTGREISTLVNSTLSVGKYRVDFNAGNLSSGTYFYRLETDSYVLTKKMVLVK